MKTITDAINERLSRTRNMEKTDLENRIEETYKKYPGLRKIDSALVEVRTSRLICAIDHDKEPLAALQKREDDILKERKEYIDKNKIDPFFDREHVNCKKCEDTGFTKTKDGRRAVCRACMQDAIDETFTKSGMKDFGSYTLKAFDLARNKDDKGERKRQFEGLRALMEGKTEKPLMLLKGGVQTGKTYLAVVACKYAIMLGLSAYYVKADRLYELSRADQDELKDYDFVVIDDYSPEVTRLDKTATALHSLLEARQASGRATVIVSSAPLEVLVAESEERIAGKLKSAGTL